MAAMPAVMRGERHVRRRNNAEYQRGGPDQNFIHGFLLPLTQSLFQHEKVRRGIKRETGFGSLFAKLFSEIRACE
jgi:hypothetical protein